MSAATSDSARIAELEAEVAGLKEVLVQQWGVFSDCFILGDNPKLREKAFLSFDRRLRKLGLLPKVTT